VQYGVHIAVLAADITTAVESATATIVGQGLLGALAIVVAVYAIWLTKKYHALQELRVTDVNKSATERIDAYRETARALVDFKNEMEKFKDEMEKYRELIEQRHYAETRYGHEKER
jgi:hypothetical protein